MEAAFGVHISFVTGLPSIISREAASRSSFPSHRASSMERAAPTSRLRRLAHLCAQVARPALLARTIIRLTLRSLETDWASPPKTRPSDSRWVDSDQTTAWEYT